MKRLTIILTLLCTCVFAMAQQEKLGVDLTKATIVYRTNDAPLVKQMANVLADDIERVSGTRPEVSGIRNEYQFAYFANKEQYIVLATVKHVPFRHHEIKGAWERYAIETKNGSLYICGSDARGLAYGVLHISEQIGVSPWYWFADVPVDKTNRRVYDYQENMVSKSPSIKYRGIFINDEDWGLKTWAAQTFEKELGDIGPKTYDRVCELILRLKGNMLAPAMHSCTGAFYSHPESQKMADKWGIMITTSHCEPLLFNNASPSEWNHDRDGEWNYETNSQTILKKLDDRIRETAQFDNIYTMGMRGLHDEAMKGSTDPRDRARTLEKVFTEQRNILTKYKKGKITSIPQIFVPYKETLDIYDAGLRVPDDITLVWPDDNYGYMKRVSNSQEQQKKGHSGVYYHISYLGTPHDNLWIATTAPMLMYEELLKAYTAGADRYWLLNVGDIKPMEMEMQMFMDMAFNFHAFTYENANKYQAEWLARVFGNQYRETFQFILDNYYRLAWDRKPEFMGYEMEWDEPEYSRLHDTDFSFETGTAQKRLICYQDICNAYDAIEREVASNLRPALFEILGYAVHSAYQINRKFLFAQANHETGKQEFARMSRDAHQEIQRLIDRYHQLFNGKWNQMISEVPPGYTALYHQMPELTDKPTDAFRLPDNQRHPELLYKLDLTSLKPQPPFRLLEGIGTDWKALQLSQPLDGRAQGSMDIAIPIGTLPNYADSIRLCISAVPMWPVATDRSNRFGVSVDGGKTVVCENIFKEWGREWKIQVLENRKDFLLTLPLSKNRREHIITLSILDPGQIIQKITYQ